MLNKAIKFLKHTFSRQKASISRRLVSRFFFFFHGLLFGNRIALSYIPDSIAHAKAYSEINELYKKFRKFNKANNGGDLHRLTSFVLNIEKVLGEDAVAGEIAELGVWRGNTAAVLAYYAKKFNRKCYLFDTFEGFNKKDLKGIDKKFKEREFSNTSLEMVKTVIGQDVVEHCSFYKGYFPESITNDIESVQFSVVSLDADLYEPMKAGLDWFFPRMHNGGLLLLHDYSSKFWDGCKKAIDEFCAHQKQHVILMPDKSGSAFIRVQK